MVFLAWMSNYIPTVFCGILSLVHAQNTVRCRYNAVNFLKNINKRHPIARPLGRGMGCLLWIQHLIDILPQFLQLLMQYFTILHRIITALDCTCLWKSPGLIQHKLTVFSCDQAALWMVQSVRLSVRPSVCLSVRPSVCLSHLFDYVPIILSSWNFQELLPVTKVTSMQKVKVRGQRSRSQRSQPNLTVSGL